MGWSLEASQRIIMNTQYNAGVQPRLEPVSSEMDETRPSRLTRDLETFQPIRISQPQVAPPRQIPPAPRKTFHFGPILLGLFAFSLAYFFLPFHTNILILGVDSGLERGDLG